MLGIKVLTFPPSAPFCPLKPYTRCTLKPLCNYSNPIEFQTLTMKTLDESDVGILCYISQLPGFRGVLKQRSLSHLHLVFSSFNLSLDSGFSLIVSLFRYSDFIVNEVDFDGNVVHLTSFDLPPEVVAQFFFHFMHFLVLFLFFPIRDIFHEFWFIRR